MAEEGRYFCFILNRDLNCIRSFTILENTPMSRYLAILALVITLGLSATSTVEAGGWGRPRRFGRRPVARPVAPIYRPASPYGYAYPYSHQSAEELYPKYIGSFHYRHLDNIGIPTGDIGIRGNGLYMSPW